MRTPTTTIQGVRAGITVVLAALMLLMPLTSLAQDATPTDADTSAELTAESAKSAQVAPMPGSLQVTLTGSTGLGLSGSVAVTDSAGVYQEVWVSESFGQAASLAAGTATVTQMSGTTDYAVDATPQYIEIPEGGIGYATITNAFLDADGDGVGDSVDACPAGNDAIDTDGDGTADACDDTPTGDPTPSPTTEPTATATVEPTATATPASTPVAGPMSRSAVVTPAQATSYVASVSISRPSVTLKDRPAFTVTITNQGSGRLGSAEILIPGAFQYNLVEISGEVTGSGFVGGDHRWVANKVDGENLRIRLTAQSEDGVLAPAGSVTVTFTAIPLSTGTYTFTTKAWSDLGRTSNSFNVASQPTVTVNDRITSCGRVSSSNETLVNGYIMYRCSTNASDIRIDIKQLTSTWKWAYVFSDSPNLQPPAFSSLTWSYLSDIQSTPASEGLQHAFIFVTPTTTANIGSWNGGYLQFDVQNPNTHSSHADMLDPYLEEHVTRDIEYADFSMTCSSAAVNPPTQSSATVTCAIQPAAYKGNQVAQHIKVQIPASPPGWNVTATSSLEVWGYNFGPPFTVTFKIVPNAGTPSTPPTLAVSASITVADRTLPGLISSSPVEVGPVETQVSHVTATESTWGGTSNLSAKVSPAGVPGSVEFFVNGSTKSASGTVNYDPATGVATLTGYIHNLSARTTPYSVRAVFTPSGDTHAGSEATNESALLVEHEPLKLSNLTAEMSWTHPYSFDDFSQTGWIQYTVSGTAEKGWTVQVTASEFSHSGGGKPIPADSLHFATASTTEGTGLKTPATSGSLGSGPIVLSGSGETPPGPYTQKLGLTMNVPGGTPVGIYTSTITITAAAAP